MMAYQGWAAAGQAWTAKLLCTPKDGNEGGNKKVFLIISLLSVII